MWRSRPPTRQHTVHLADDRARLCPSLRANGSGTQGRQRSMSGERIPITAIVLAYNEAINIEPCLGAMADISDVVIVDSNSTDDTVAVAKHVRPDVRVFSNPFKDFGEQRNWALDNCSPRH